MSFCSSPKKEEEEMCKYAIFAYELELLNSVYLYCQLDAGGFLALA
jgi:hypothetical protein